MKKILYILPILALLPCAVTAQTGTENYVMTETMLNASGTSMKAVQYYNGLGYPTVGVAATGGGGQTAYTLTTYDGAGREECQYLPVATDNSIAYKAPNTIITNSTSFYGNDNTGYTRNHYDALDRVLSTELPGQAWRTADKRNTMVYDTNTAADKVLRYTASSANNTLTATNQNYAAGTLTKETAKDADGKPVVTFKDLTGKVILQRTGSNLDTYYVYDELDHLRFVLPPAFTTSDNNGDKAIYRYEYRYDERGRVTTKLLPGAGYIEYWHDTADRVICMQDAMMRKAGKYRFTIYDQFGRVAIQGLCTNYKNKSNHNANPTVTAVYEGKAGFLNSGYTVSNGTTLFPGATLEVVNYYDKYDFISKNYGSRFASLSAPSSSDATGQLTGSAVLAGNGEWVAQAMGYDLRGNLTETKSRELKRGSTTRVASRTNTYTYTNNLKSSTGTVGVAYGGNLSLTETYEYNTKNDKKSSYQLSIAHGNAAVSSKTTYAYNALGQLSTITRPFTGNATKTVTYTYDLHGWLTGITTNSFAEELFYASGPGTKLYNGNISSMRWKSADYSQKCGYKFTYDTANRLTKAVYGEKDNLGTNANRFNENITYDKNGNIKSLTRRGRMQNGKYGIVDTLSIIYNGNQLKTVTDRATAVTYAGSLDFKGAKGTAYSYTYNENGSLLTDQSRGIAFISYDLSGNPQKIYFTNGSITKYVYSATGQKLRMVHYTAAANITRTIGQHVELKKADIQSTDSTDYLLGGSLVVRNGKIDKYLFDGGYAQATASGTTDKFTFYYQNKDHLGTVRETVTSTGAMKQRVNYYPFGGQLVDTLKAMIWNRDFQQYKYNGKEFDGTFGLNTYDYGARQHYPVLARWDRIDPLCEKYYGISPYAYCANNPVNNIDLHGDSIFIGYEYQQEILEMINNVSEGVFDVDENGYLYLKDQTKPSVDTGKYSKYYQEQLVYGINSSNTISVRVASEANYKGKSFQLDNYGQGLTITDNSQAHVYVSGESHTTQSGTYCNPSIILAHELAGHAIPSVTDSYMQSSYDGLAVSAENTIRSEIGLPLRNWGSYEEGHRSVSSFINPIGRVITNRQLPIKK